MGDTVRRSRGSDFAAQVLRHLECAGYPYAPRYLGVDEKGRDILTFIPGHTTDHPSQRADGAYRLAGSMLRALHDVTAGHPLAGGEDCVMHGDPGPFNAIVQDGLPVAFIDWSGCRPGGRLDDLGYLAWTWCVQESGGVPVAAQAAHLREARDGYGDVDAVDLVEAMVRRQEHIIAAEQLNLRDTALSETRRRHARTAIDWATGARALVRRHEATFVAALRESR
ncbi:phosphotransferase [Actinokineospora auranticolor]|uniref:phosphotransferase n=1 Tax=Actinokineospora auranticolor TaxID=155976 RepID=UPI001FE4D404|nr:phosphotransferase [Actinokineospora auranticolor]